MKLIRVVPTDGGTYTVKVSNSAGFVVSSGAVLTVSPVRHISNLSILTDLSLAGEAFTVGYVVGGAGTSGAKPLIVRAGGPALGAFGIVDVLANPRLEFFAGSVKTGEVDDWGGGTKLVNQMAAVGAFANSPDAAAAIVATQPNNSAVISSSNGATGRVIAELYDATPPSEFLVATPRLFNVSVLKDIRDGLTAGFVIVGNSGKGILIRAIGPTLALPPFLVGGTVADVRLTLFSGQEAIGANDDWGGTPALTKAFSDVGAFPLPPDSRDAVLLVRLPPGPYTARVTGANSTSGVALLEVYELP